MKTGSRKMPPYSKSDAVLASLREQPPLVHCITNYVSMDFMANCLLAVGASPAMVHSSDEVKEFTPLASALNINIGTISAAWLNAMISAAKIARELGKPCVLDPVAVGATSYRQQACQAILATGAVSLIRGNASEIIACARLYEAEAQGEEHARGVDSLDPAEAALQAARVVNSHSQAIVVISGVSDYVVSDDGCWRIDGGDEYLARVTASGCSLNALLAACLAAYPQDRVQASVAALNIFSVCAQSAAQTSSGPGSFRAQFLDALYNLSPQQLSASARVTEIAVN